VKSNEVSKVYTALYRNLEKAGPRYKETWLLLQRRVHVIETKALSQPVIPELP
jgi:hypothetical protein